MPRKCKRCAGSALINYSVGFSSPKTSQFVALGVSKVEADEGAPDFDRAADAPGGRQECLPYWSISRMSEAHAIVNGANEQ